MPNLTIRLPEEKLLRLRQAAGAHHKSANTLVEEAIDAYLPRLAGPSLADALQDFIGAGGAGPPTDSSRMSEAMAEILDEKHRGQHL